MIFGLKKKYKEDKPLSIKEFYKKRNKLLITRSSRGIGDILNCRMLFRNFKKLIPDVNITFACLKEYLPLVEGHSCLEKAIPVENINKKDYMLSYDISRCCIVHESKSMGNNTKHRAEIWADHCGIQIEDHNMDLPFISNDIILNCLLEVKQAKNLSKYNRNGPSVLLAPLAYEFLRSLTKQQLTATVGILRNKGMFVYGLHTANIPLLQELEVPVLVGKTLFDWMGYIHAADYVVSVDTGTFHYAGGIGKPLVGIFTHVDGKLRGKYYDFVLVQKHRDNGDWPCGPCYNYLCCSHEKCEDPKSLTTLRPCVTELTIEEIEQGIEKMISRWPR